VDKEKIINIFNKTGALKTGHFLLSSGLHSEKYLQCALVLQYPNYTKQMCAELALKFNDKNPTLVVGPALGGVLVSFGVAEALGVKSLFTEREENIMKLRRSFEIKKTDRVIIVEDVITTGRSTNEVINVVKTSGAEIVGIGAIVDRSDGKINFPVEVKSLIRFDIPTYQPETCPLCAKNIPVTKPGSRKQ